MNTASASATGPVRSVVKLEPPGAHVAGDQIVQPRLVDRQFAAPQHGDLVGVLVDAGHVVAEIGKAGPGNEPDIAGTDHRDAHQGRAIMVNNSIR